jgi:hypothetical protein
VRPLSLRTAPLLLDVHNHRAATVVWWQRADLESIWSGSASDDPESRWSDHVAEARRVVEGETLFLGRPPADLIEVLGDLAIGGPASIALRALSHVCGGLIAWLSLPIQDHVDMISWTRLEYPETLRLIVGVLSRAWTTSGVHAWYLDMIQMNSTA